MTQQETMPAASGIRHGVAERPAEAGLHMVAWSIFPNTRFCVTRTQVDVTRGRLVCLSRQGRVTRILRVRRRGTTTARVGMVVHNAKKGQVVCVQTYGRAVV